MRSEGEMEDQTGSKSDPEARQLRTRADRLGFPTPSKRPGPSNYKGPIPTKLAYQSSKAIAASSSQQPTNQAMKEFTETDPVQVYCRVKPLDPPEGETCVEVKFPNSICVFPPPSLPWNKAKQGTYTFNNVFDENSTQKSLFDEVARPLVQDLLDGKSSLLFAYGVTGSGKTFTMSGTPNEPGVMPRVLDVLFNSIRTHKAAKHSFKTDHMNGFEAQTKADIMLHRQEFMKSTSHRPLRSATNGVPLVQSGGSSGPESDEEERSHDRTILPLKYTHSVFSVFVTYVQIYNKSIYDLLDDASYVPDFSKKTSGPQAKITRSDPSGNMYVHNVVEVEVESAEEALQVLKRGQKRRKFAQTLLNTESSRSHSIFNVRLVQAPYDTSEDEIADDKNLIRLSQLSLVDLAGSERNTRTQTVGDRLREAGRINTSIMNLHKCMVALRKRQQKGERETGGVPYRDDKLTNYLKSYFEGQGRIRMLLCLNPSAEDYDENLHVCTFAEQAQEIEVVRQPTRPDPVPATPRRKINGILKATPKSSVDELPLAVVPSLASIPISLADITQTLPLERYERPEDGREPLQKLRRAIEERLNAKTQLSAHLLEKKTEFRNLLAERERWISAQAVELETMGSKLEKADEELRTRNSVIEKLTLEKVELAEDKEKMERSNETLLQEMAKLKAEYRKLELANREERSRLVTDLGLQRELDSRKRERQMKQEEARLMAEYKVKDKAIAAMKELVNQVDTGNVRVSRSMLRRARNESLSTSDSDLQLSNESGSPSTRKTRSSMKLRVASEPRVASSTNFGTPIEKSDMAVAGMRRARSQAVDGGKWLEHAPRTPLKSTTLFKPLFNKSKSVSKLVRIEDLTSAKTSNYCLRMDVQDSGGETETQLFKGDVIPTVTGGAQMIFNDVEILKQRSPLAHLASVSRKRASEVGDDVDREELSAKCRVGISNVPQKKWRIDD